MTYKDFTPETNYYVFQIPSFSIDSPESLVYDSDKDSPYSPEFSDFKVRIKSHIIF